MSTLNTFSVHLSVVIPAHNEAENLRVLLPELDNALQHISAEMVVVNNASTDATARQKIRQEFSHPPEGAVQINIK